MIEQDHPAERDAHGDDTRLPDKSPVSGEMQKGQRQIGGMAGMVSLAAARLGRTRPSQVQARHRMAAAHEPGRAHALVHAVLAAGQAVNEQDQRFAVGIMVLGHGELERDHVAAAVIRFQPDSLSGIRWYPAGPTHGDVADGLQVTADAGEALAEPLLSHRRRRATRVSLQSGPPPSGPAHVRRRES